MMRRGGSASSPGSYPGLRVGAAPTAANSLRRSRYNGGNMRFIFMLLLVASAYCKAPVVVDVHEAWESYPSADVKGEDYNIPFADESKLAEMNRLELSNIVEAKLRYLNGRAIMMLSGTATYKDYVNVGVLYAQNGFYSNALRHFKKAQGLNSSHSDIYNNIANIYYMTRQDSKAIKYYKKALRYDKNNPITLLNLAFLSYESGRFKAAEKYYTYAVIIDPTLDRPEYKVLAGEEDVGVGKKASNKGVDRLTIKWSTLKY